MPDLTIEERIRERAYALWERAGMPEGRDDQGACAASTARVPALYHQSRS